MSNTQFDNYKEFCKPKLSELLRFLKLDKEYVFAKGNQLRTSQGVIVTDFIGGFGAVFLGHNPEELKRRACELIASDKPVYVQVSVRGEAAGLAQRLSDLVPSGCGYCVNFSNSGTESVEAAIKHAYKVHFDKVRREYERLTRILNDFYYEFENNENKIVLPVDKPLVDFRDDLDEYNLTQLEDFQNNPAMIAMKGSFHGKTSASLKVTFNKSFREPYEGLSSICPLYVNPDRPERIAELVEETACTFYYPVIQDQRVAIRPFRITKVIGLILETILGEGGIHPLKDTTLQYLVDQHAKLGIPYILDEIQTGCGRTGTFFSYEQTPLREISPEYILLSKALGGGMVKIGATMIRNDVYDQDFGILHTSTFGEDEFSSCICHGVLDMLQADNGQLMKDALNKGEYLKTKLKELQDKYPDIIKEVRGRGLMIGVEFTDLKERSPFFRASGKQGILSLLIASYLLEHHHLRVLAPLTTILKGNPGKKRQSILRIQPPATITDDLMDRLIEGLDEVCRIINYNNEFCLIGHLLGVEIPQELLADPTYCEIVWPVIDEHHHIDARTGFVVHPTTLAKLKEYYFPSFRNYAVEDENLRTWWNGISRFLEPVHVKCDYIRSNDFVVENSLVLVPYLPEYLKQAMGGHLLREVQDKIQDAVIVAKELGDDNIPMSMVGLGAYTSIVTMGGLTLNDYEMNISTGNAYTTALTILGIIKASNEKGLRLEDAAVSIVGAAGNIGTVMARILSSRVGRLQLVGRPSKGSLKRLQFVKDACFKEIIFCLQSRMQVDDTNVPPDRLGQTALVILEYLNAHVDPDASIAYSQLLKENAPAASMVEDVYARMKKQDASLLSRMIVTTTNLQDIKTSDIVIAVTNSHDLNMITRKMVKEGAIVCGTSVPGNLSPDFKNSDGDVIAFDGGLALLPENSRINFVGMPQKGMCYGCLAETLLLGFDGQNHSFSKGELHPGLVYRTMEMASVHGFTIGPLMLEEKVVLS